LKNVLGVVTCPFHFIFFISNLKKIQFFLNL